MASVNKVILIGNLGADPEMRAFPSGDTLCNLRLATSEQWKDKTTGEQRESTEWHRVVLFRRLTEIAHQYLKKGAQVYIEGRLRTRKWQDSDGTLHDRGRGQRDEDAWHTLNQLSASPLNTGKPTVLRSR